MVKAGPHAQTVRAVYKERPSRKPAHTLPQPEVSQQGTITQCAGKLQHILDVLTAHQGNGAGRVSRFAFGRARGEGGSEIHRCVYQKA